MFSNILFVPAVNRDSYEWISSAYSTEDYSFIQPKRKNMNDLNPCNEIYLYENETIMNKVNTGVDLNRNYDGKSWGKNDERSKDPCSQTYRGNSIKNKS
jgi:hypothetical protein